ncbi:MAG: hypothetical protein V4501_02795 [Pseudomonadota bacterium]
MFLHELIAKVEKAFQDNILPVYNQDEIQKKIANIKTLDSAPATRAALLKLCRELGAAGQAMLSLKNQTNFSVKAIKKLLGQVKIRVSTGNINVDVISYVNITEINADFCQTYLLNDNNHHKIMALMQAMNAMANHLNNSNIPYLLTQAGQTRTPREAEINLLQTEKANLFECLEQAKNVINTFDTQITELYECTVSQIYTTLPLLMLSLDTVVSRNLTEVTNFHSQLAAASAYKEIVFVIGDPAEANIRTNIVIIYLYTLKNIKKFLLSIDQTKETLAPDMLEKKQLILKEFNKKFKRAWNNLKELTNEVKLRDVLKTDKESVDITDTSATQSAPLTTNRKKAIINIVVIGRDIKIEDLPTVAFVKYTLINDNEILLAEAEFAYKIQEIEWLLKNVSAAFAETPRHLVLLPDILSKSDLEVHLKAADEEKLQLEKNYNDYILTLAGMPFSFEKNAELMAVNNLIQTIKPALLKLQHEINEVAETAENLLKFSNQLTSINKDINNATKIFNKFISFYSYYEHKGNQLLQKHHKLSVKLQDLNLFLEKIEKSYADLQKENWLQRKSRQPLDDITLSLTKAKTELNDAATSLNESALLLNDSNQFAAIEISLKSVIDRFGKFTQAATPLQEAINKESIYFHNNHIRRFGNNPNRLQLNTAAPATLIEEEEKKRAIP